ncbi:type III secretion system export apparatus subunit SctS [Roseiconus lacunae]|uniref:type III secretion system export apparatus subunit SctS n=1 Tax=Roseiconus lacunae TaxID=2605694 RepID=UPI001E2CE69A|nr:type III secretion system export apparatus subunit SctS [Roseiconus lacunae]MCD0457854.1 type III secretion system export apparatus subunit SctS [Roseiconus lacunae]
MSTELILNHTVTMAVLVLTLSMAPILAATVTGLIVSLFQALTQVQEQTLSFAVKLVTVTITLLVTARWMGGELYIFTVLVFEQFGMVSL